MVREGVTNAMVLAEFPHTVRDVLIIVALTLPSVWWLMRK